MSRATGDFLAAMARASRIRARRLVARVPRRELERRARAAAPPPRLDLAPDGFDVVAEVKFASPSAGALAPAPGAVRAAAQAARYAAGGAAAISVLTEPARFRGSLAHLRAAARAVRVPILCKDFLVDRAQVLAARAAGAAGVLLVVRMLARDELARLVESARALELFVLLEAFDERDLERAARHAEDAGAGHALVGVNARDLRTLAVVPERHLSLAPRLPRGFACVAESGIETPDDAAAAAAAGYRLGLVGSALMRAPDPAGALLSLVAAGRAAARRAP